MYKHCINIKNHKIFGFKFWVQKISKFSWIEDFCGLKITLEIFKHHGKNNSSKDLGK